MTMRTRSYRAGDQEWALIVEAADAGQVSPSRFVREAAIARAIYEQGMRSADPGKTILEIIRRLRPEDTPPRGTPAPRRRTGT